jgi:cytochrome c
MAIPLAPARATHRRLGLCAGRSKSRLAVAVVAAALLLGCQKQTRVTAQATAFANESAPKAFRSTLDGRTRVLTTQLADRLWAAWDVEHCTLFKLWPGGVDLEGVVYTGHHGPQPASRGLAWLAADDANPWRIRLGEHELRPRVRYRGHRLDGGDLVLRYDLEADDGTVVTIEERPAVVTRDDGVTGLERRFSLHRTRGGGTGDADVLLDVAVGALDPSRDVESDGDLEPRPSLSEAAQTVRLTLLPHDTRLVLWLGDPPTVTAPARHGPHRPAGLILVEQNDCVSCHTLDGHATIGPTFQSIAVRYDRSATNRLARRVITGGSGDWGSTAMTPHPDLSESDARNIVSWILSLAHGDAQAAPPPPEPPLRRFGRLWDLWDATPALAHRLWPGNAPGDALPVPGVHPSFDLETIQPPGFEPRVGGLDFLPDGRLVVATWDPNGAVYVIDGLQSDPPSPRATRIAEGLAEPLGVRVVDGDIYVMQKPELTRLRDRDGDGRIDEYDTIADDWNMSANYHEFAFGLAYRDGFFYGSLATDIVNGVAAPVQTAGRGSVLRIAKDGGAVRVIADGVRTPNGLAFGPFGLLYVTDNQGNWLPANELLAIDPASAKRAFFGSRIVLGDAAADLPVTPPVLLLPEDEISNSPAEPATLNVGPYHDQLLIADVTHGGLIRAFVERVAGSLQGAAFRFSQGFEAGLNRIVWGPDGRLYVGGIGSTGNWGQPGKERYGLQRLTWNGRTTFEMLAVRAVDHGFDVEFTEPLAAGTGEQPQDYRVEQWRYEATADYGGPKIDLENLTVSKAAVSADRRHARLMIEGLQPGHVVHLRLHRGAFRSESGDPLWSTEAWYTLNALP